MEITRYTPQMVIALSSGPTPSGRDRFVGIIVNKYGHTLAVTEDRADASNIAGVYDIGTVTVLADNKGMRETVAMSKRSGRLMALGTDSLVSRVTAAIARGKSN
jgi:hypothetical protein